ncbi:MAG: hypothetical protein JWM86_60, partial [Thermoleophilia bacterium]|nr:hypothetical protein [Thermoleophilia bacterium]
VQAAQSNPVDQATLDRAQRLDLRAANYDRAALRFVVRARTFRIAASTRLLRVVTNNSSTQSQVRGARAVRALLASAGRMRIAAASASRSADQARIAANATTPPNQTQLATVARFDARAALLLRNAARLEARAMLLVNRAIAAQGGTSNNG